MKIRVPDYFNDFKCIADKCLDSCCIGWEIDVDAGTRAKYEALDTSLGLEICEKTSHGYFPLCENGRCAFLDGSGLCRIISALGEGYLCDICREHPRYYGVGGRGYEGGLGLGCEEAARIILSLNALPKLVEIERDIPYSNEDEYANVSEYFREELYGGIFTMRTEEIIGKYIAYATVADTVAFEVCAAGGAVQIPQVTYDTADSAQVGHILTSMLELLSECEALDDSWYTLIDKAHGVDVKLLTEERKSFKGLLYYFTHRYVREGVLDMSLGQRILFALGSALTVVALIEVVGGDEADIRAAVLYSKSVEYSTDNVDMILDGLSEFL